MDECPRKVWLRRFGSWGGWDREADEQTKLAYRLKRLQSRWQWSGNLAHRAIADMIKIDSGSKVHVDWRDTIERWIGRMRREYRQSVREDWKRAKDAVVLIEHYYGQAVPDQQWARLADKVRRCLANFARSDAFRELRKGQTLSNEQINYFFVDDTKVWLSIDHLWVDGQTVEAIDWKTGKQPKQADLDQMRIYNAYMLDRGIPHTQIRSRLVYLDDPQEIVLPAEPDDLENVAERVRADMSSASARGVEIDADGNATAPVELWPMATVDDQGRPCRYCEFQEICGRYDHENK